MPSLDTTPADHTAAHALLGLPEPAPSPSPAPTFSWDPLNDFASLPDEDSVTQFLRDLDITF